MRIHRRIAINLVAVLGLGIVTVGWVVTQLIGAGVVAKPFSVVADFAATGGAFTNQEVTYRGVLVGQIGELELNEDGVDVELVIDAEWEGKIPSNVTAKVQSKSAVGEQFVNLTPRDGITSEDTLQDGDRIERTATSLPVDFQDLLSSLDLVLSDVPPEKTARLVRNLRDGLEGRSSDISSVLRSLGTLADAFADVAPEQQSLLENATIAGTEFVRTKDNFAEAIRAADEVFAGIGDEPEELARLFRSNDLLARRGVALLARRGDDLAGGIRGLRRFVSYQLSQKDEIVKALEYVPQFLHAIEDSAIPWRSPDGREFYRIRTGLVVDNVPSTWPCKFEVPSGYTRLPHDRAPKEEQLTNTVCEPGSEDVSAAAADSLVAALRTWSAENDVDDLAATDPSIFEEIPPLAPGEGFTWPLDGVITSYFGMRDGRPHTGVDIDGSLGDAIVAADDGTVIHSGVFGEYGETIVIQHDDGLATLYAHLSRVDVEVGEPVTRGAPIGAVGCTGSCTGDHLHFEVHLNGEAVDPLPYLPGGMLYAGAGSEEV